MKWIQKHREALLIIALTIASISLYTFKLDRESLSLDEVTSFLVSRTWGGLIDTFLNKDRNMWLYYLILYPFLKFGDTEFWIRLPSALIATGGVLAMYFLGKTVKGKKVGIIAAILLMLNTVYLYHAQDARSYSLFTSLIILSHWALERYVKHPTRSRAIAYVGAALAAIYAHVFAVIPIAIQVVYIASVSHGNLRKRIVLASTLIGAFFIGILPLAITLISSSYHEISAGTKTVLDWVQRPELIDLVQLYFSFAGDSILLSINFITLLAFGILTGRSRLTYLHVAILFGTIPLMFLFSVMVKPVFIERYYIYALPSVILLVAMGMGGMKRTTFIFAVLTCMLISINLLRVHYSVYRKPQYREVYLLVTKSTISNSSKLGVFFATKSLEQSFLYYRNSGKHYKKSQNSIQTFSTDINPQKYNFEKTYYIDSTELGIQKNLHRPRIFQSLEQRADCKQTDVPPLKIYTCKNTKFSPP